LLLIGFSDLEGVDAGCSSLQFTSEVMPDPISYFPPDGVVVVGECFRSTEFSLIVERVLVFYSAWIRKVQIGITKFGLVFAAVDLNVIRSMRSFHEESSTTTFSIPIDISNKKKITRSISRVYGQRSSAPERDSLARFTGTQSPGIERSHSLPTGPAYLSDQQY
jgi:hypothetical protein